jgi:hypothetical protein
MISIAANRRAITNLRRLRRIIFANGPSAFGQRKNDAHQKLEALERWSAKATLLIFFGIILDIALILYFPHDTGERIGSVAANALIGAGLIVEYVVILRAITASGEAQRESDQKVAQANTRAAEANERAGKLEKLTTVAKLQLQLLQIKVGPRRVKEDELKKTLGNVPVVPIEISFSEDDGESWGVAWQLTEALLSIEWPVIGPFPLKRSEKPELASFPPQIAAGGQATGVTLVTRSGSDGRGIPRYAAAAEAMSLALKRAINGDVAITEINPDATTIGPPPATIRIVVGPKP